MSNARLSRRLLDSEAEREMGENTFRETRARGRNAPVHELISRDALERLHHIRVLLNLDIIVTQACAQVRGRQTKRRETGVTPAVLRRFEGAARAGGGARAP